MEAKMLNGGIKNLDPYALPQNVQSIITGFNQLEKDTLEIELHGAYQINKRVRTRKEEFGSIVFIGSNLAGYLDERLTKFVDFLRFNTSQELEDLILFAESECCLKNGLQVMKNLVLKKILISKSSQIQPAD